MLTVWNILYIKQSQDEIQNCNMPLTRVMTIDVTVTLQ